MSMARRPSPVGELLSLRQAMDRLFEESFVRPRGASGTEGVQAMALDIYATGDALIVEAALPGVRPEDVDITITGDTLTINATSADERRSDEAGVVYQEIRRGATSRTVTLPDNLKTDEATASFENGILRLQIPRAEQAKPRQIRISASHDGQNARTVSPPDAPASPETTERGPSTGDEEGR